MSEEENNDSKMQAFAKLILFLFISLVSFAVGTFVGKNIDSSKEKPTVAISADTDTVSDIAEVANNEATNTDNEIDNEEATTIITEEDVSEEISSIDNKGIQNVAKEIEATKKKLLEKIENKPAAKKAIIPGDYKYTIQVSSFDNELEAQSRVKNLKSRGFDNAFYIPAVVRGTTWYRVGLDFFETYKEAANKKTELTKRGAISDAIVQKVEL